jgi:glycolate oxidase
LVFDDSVRQAHSGDKWFAAQLPDAVALPRQTETIATLLRFANQHDIPVTPRGAGYGYVGGCVPACGGISLSLSRLNQIKEIHAGDFVTVVQPGVNLKTLQDAVEAKGLYYPPDPASRADCSIGGNIATNAGGPRCLKYGVTRDFVIGLEVVLADGEVVRVGGRTHKNKSGFDFTGLFTGSEGMLGIVTEATLKLIPLPPFRALLVAGFDDMATAARALRAIFAAGFLPCALELADEFTLEAARRRTKSKALDGLRAVVMVEMDGHEKSVRGETPVVEKLLRALKPRLLKRAYGNAACEQLWQLRREFSTALRDTGLTKLNEDIVVPRGRLEDLFVFTARLQKKSGMPIACFGHAGDGNIHVNVMYDKQWPEAEARSRAVLDELFQQIVAWNGVITGEHGIGLAKKPWWPLASSPALRDLHSRIKKSLDPKGILNPGKFV